MATPEQIKSYKRKYREENREKIRKSAREHYPTHKEKLKQYRVTHKAQHRQWKLKSKYGLTLEQMEQMFITQNGQCAICQKEFDNWSKIHVDHNHTTGQVRQLLCSNCNTAIGLVHDNINTLTNAIKYLHKWNTPIQ